MNWPKLAKRSIVSPWAEASKVLPPLPPSTLLELANGLKLNRNCSAKPSGLISGSHTIRVLTKGFGIFPPSSVSQENGLFLRKSRETNDSSAKLAVVTTLPFVVVAPLRAVPVTGLPVLASKPVTNVPGVVETPERKSLLLCVALAKNGFSPSVTFAERAELLV